MRISFLTETGETYGLEVDPSMELENIMALLEAECGIPIAEQTITHDGQELTDPKATLSGAGIQNDAMLHLQRKVIVAGRQATHDAEMMRLQILGDPSLMQRLRDAQPELADAVQNDPQRFVELIRQYRERHPFDVDAQARTEEAIRQQAVLENMEHAIEYSPEFFGRVIMLYIPVEVNGCPVKAFVDSGAQQTIMSPECAERCGLLRLLDKRFAGIAKGVGTAKILGRVHSAQLKLEDLHLPCAFTIMEGRDVDLLFGLDMLKAHQACIDLEKNVLRIQGREVRFLSEHELPDKARMDTSAELEAASKSESASASASASASTAPTQPGSTSNTPAPHFPGGGNTLGAAPTNSAGSARAPVPQPPRQPSSFPEESIQALVNFGATREQAIQLLQAARGNVEVAGSLLFQ